MKEAILESISLMTITILIIVMAILVAITYSQKQVINKLDKLIELNTPEFINVVPEKIVVEGK